MAGRVLGSGWTTAGFTFVSLNERTGLQPASTIDAEAACGVPAVRRCAKGENVREGMDMEKES